MYTMDHTFGYRSKKFIHRRTKWSVEAQGMNSEAEILNIVKLPWDSQGNGHFATVSQGAIQTLDGS